jgi:hypothetical protein
MKNLLKPFGGENDQAYLVILTWFNENRDRRVNSAELSLMGFKRLKKAQHVYVSLSPETIARKARQLAEWGLLDKGYDTSHHTWFSWPTSQNLAPEGTPDRPEFKIVGMWSEKDGNGMLTGVVHEIYE